ncbi:hypothetical protein DL96DRAFT_1613260 [Flagelloscypha sp. PMI_526]|nr:hypothetical protein DL96DRAFT_1613260 [Flagelloscypha sp. PMI_526]
MGAMVNSTTFADLPDELQQEVFSIAVLSMTTHGELFNTLILCKTSYNFAYPMLYSTLIIEDRTLEFFIQIFNKHRVPFGAHCKALRIMRGTLSGSMYDAVFLSLIPGLPKLEHFESFFGLWDPATVHVGSLQKALDGALGAILALPNLRHLRLDWHFNHASRNAPLSQSYPMVSHLRIVVSGDMKPLLHRFPNLTHLQLIFPDIRFHHDFLSHCLSIFQTLQVLLVCESNPRVGAAGGREFVYDDPRVVVVQGTDSWVADDFLNIVKDDDKSVWRRAQLALDQKQALHASK